jgi:hypothetical protein
VLWSLFERHEQRQVILKAVAARDVRLRPASLQARSLGRCYLGVVPYYRRQVSQFES